MQIMTTLNDINVFKYEIGNGWNELLESLGKTEPDDEPLDMIKILEIVGVRGCVRCFKAYPRYSEAYRLLALDFIEPTRHLIKDKIFIDALVAAKQYSYGHITESERSCIALEVHETTNKKKSLGHLMIKEAVYTTVSMYMFDSLYYVVSPTAKCMVLLAGYTKEAAQDCGLTILRKFLTP